MHKDLKLKKGDKVVWAIRGNENNKYTSIITNSGYTVKEFECNDKVLKVLRPTGYKTVYEVEKKILDEEEKKYLSAVIKPFKNSFLYIVKEYDLYDSEYQLLIIALKGNRFIQFPSFEKDTMYKGMHVGRKYTLKELGLE